MKRSGRQWASPPGWQPRPSGCGSAIWCSATHFAIRRCWPNRPSPCRTPRTADSSSASGSGSWPAEFARFDVGQQDPVARVEQLERHLGLLMQYWGRDEAPERTPIATSRASDTADPRRNRAPDDGTCSQIRGLVEHTGQPSRSVAASWRPSAGRLGCRCSRWWASFAGTATRTTVREVSTRRFGNLGSGLVCGDADELIRTFRQFVRPRRRAVLCLVRRFRRPGLAARIRRNGDQSLPG